MKRHLQYLLLFAAFYACHKKQNEIIRKQYTWPQLAAPVCEKRPQSFTLHGDTRTDNYHWLNGFFYKNADSAFVLDYLEAENRYADTMMAGTANLQKLLYNEMKGRFRENDETFPVYKNGYYYYSRYTEGKDYFVYCRKKGSLEAGEEVLLDVNAMAEGNKFFSVTGLNVSPDNRMLTFAVDTLSRRQYTIYVKDLDKGEVLPDKIDGTAGYTAWGNDNKTFFYASNNPLTLQPEKINRHKLGVPADVTVYEEKDKTNRVYVWRSLSGKYIFISSETSLSSEIRLLNADKPDSSFSIFQPRMKDVLYMVAHQNDHFLVTTNWNARNFKLMSCPLTKTDSAQWTDLIPHRDSVLLNGVLPFRNHLVISERKEGLLQVRIRKLSDASEHYLAFDEPAYLAYLAGNLEYDTKNLRFNYTSLTTPLSVYDYDMDSREKILRKQTEVVGGYNKNQYISERVYAAATDGSRIPVSLVYKKGLKKDGSNPCLLYGYGAYGNSQDAAFNVNRMSLLDRGFVYAIAHIRGGQELGRQWYEDGKLLKKMNSFTDFINCAEFLIGQNYTSKGHLYASGNNAGGLLIGVVVNMRPDLWKGVVANMPFVDVINTMNDANMPLTTNDYGEWGNPAVKEQYLYMKLYDPYENIKPQNYPHILVTAGLYDAQVQHFEPAKWVAKLRGLKTGNSLLLMKTNMKAGNGGAAGRFKVLEDVALQFAFYLSLEGIGG